MRTLVLERPKKLATEHGTPGIITAGDVTLASLERPWIPEKGHKGGKPFESCVPDGVYTLRRHTRSTGQIVLALENHALNVYYTEAEVPSTGGRYLILIHVGNWVKDVVGCIAPGLARVIDADPFMVTKSLAAMNKIMEFVKGDDARIDIRWI